MKDNVNQKNKFYAELTLCTQNELFFPYMMPTKKNIYLCSPNSVVLFKYADVMKLVDMLDLGSSASRRVGSSPPIRTNLMMV